MEQGLDEDTASREAYAEFYPDEYDVDDYDEIYSSSTSLLRSLNTFKFAVILIDKSFNLLYKSNKLSFFINCFQL